MRVVVAQHEDIPAWLVLTGEIEHLFGPMLDDPDFHRALARNVERSSAFCVRAEDGPPGAPLLGGLMFSATQAPTYRIGWLAVTAAARRRGVGRRLVEHVVGLVRPPADLAVLTFGPTHPDGQAARGFYVALGFAPAELTPGGPDGFPRQIYRRQLR